MAVTINGTSGILGGINSMTAQNSTSGTSITFSSIPSGVKRITVMFNGVSTSGTSNIIVQVGAGSVTTTGYASGGSYQGIAESGGTGTNGFIAIFSPGSATTVSGMATICTLGSNIWVMSGVFGRTNESYTQIGGGNITLGGTLDRVVITTANGTDTFDAGSINVLYE